MLCNLRHQLYQHVILCSSLFLFNTEEVPDVNTRWQQSFSRRAGLTSQHRVLVLGCADQPADTINHLALRVQLFLLGLLAEENHWKGKQRVRQGIKKKMFGSQLILKNKVCFQLLGNTIV